MTVNVGWLDEALAELNLFHPKLSLSFDALIPKPARFAITTGMFLVNRVTSVSTIVAGQLELYPAAALLATAVPAIAGALAHLVEVVAGDTA